VNFTSMGRSELIAQIESLQERNQKLRDSMQLILNGEADPKAWQSDVARAALAEEMEFLTVVDAHGHPLTKRSEPIVTLPAPVCMCDLLTSGMVHDEGCKANS
jgi:hypothetical protein